MLSRSSRALLLLCAGILGGLGLAAPPEEEELWQTWMRLALGETPVVQLLEDTAHRMGNGSSPVAAELREGLQLVPPHLHQEQEGPRDVCPRRESDLLLQEVLEKLQRLNQSLELTLEALEDTRSWLENLLERLQAVPNPDAQSPSGTSTSVPHGSCWALLVLLLPPAPLRVILLLLLLFPASGALGIPELSALLLLAVAGLAASRGIRPAVSREKCRHRLTSTPEREHDLELLQEELDRLELSCVRGAGGCADPGRGSESRPCPHPVPAHPSSQSVPKLCPGTWHHSKRPQPPPGALGGRLNVLPEPSNPEQPQEVAGDIPDSIGWESPVSGGRRRSRSSCGAALEPVTDFGKRREPKPSIPRASTSPMSPRRPCRALTRAGQRCRKKAVPGKSLCHVHASGRSSAMDSPLGFDPPPPP